MILGVLTAIVIPFFLSQRSRAHDGTVKVDVSILVKEVATFFVEGNGPLSLSTAASGQLSLTDGSSNSSARLTSGDTPPATGASSNLDQPQGWRFALTDPQGGHKPYKYRAFNGLQPGACP
jgi:type IV pilus assembly protein PilA